MSKHIIVTAVFDLGTPEEFGFTDENEEEMKLSTIVDENPMSMGYDPEYFTFELLEVEPTNVTKSDDTKEEGK